MKCVQGPETNSQVRLDSSTRISYTKHYFLVKKGRAGVLSFSGECNTEPLNLKRLEILERKQEFTLSASAYFFPFPF